MSNAVTWTDNLSGTMASERQTAVRRAIMLSAVILAITVGVSVWIYFSEKHNLHETTSQAGTRGGQSSTGENAEVVRRADRLVLTMAGVAVVGGAGCLAPLLAATIIWRKRVVSQLRQKAEEWQETAAGLQAQITEIRRARDGLLVTQTDLETRIDKLTATNATLQEEVDKRNRAERVLTQRRQELESSKSVLEIHVQARTVELENLQRRHEMILNAAGEGICGFDLDGKATFVNPTVAKLTGRTLAELAGKTEEEIFFPPGQRVKVAFTGQGPGEQVFHRQDGTLFPVEFVKTPINENGRAVGSVLVFKDITERKRVDETLAQRAAELARSNAELEQFAFVASHDLQEPLRKIQAFGDRLKTRCADEKAADIRDYLDRMQNAAARMRTLINDLLAFSRVIRSSEPFVPVDLAQVTKEVLGDLELRIEKSGAKVQVGTLPTIDADPLQMRQLLLNLLGNALKFQPPGNTPVIEIQGRSFAGSSGEMLAELSVRDNGIGFDEKYLEKIFAVFQRLHGRNEYEGTGVGLAVCRRIVDRHHGSIMARSQPGKGATFVVTIPARQAKPEVNG